MVRTLEGTLVVFSWPVPAPPRERGQLSRAEREVVSMLLEGVTYAEIAGVRGTSLGTIKKQITSAYRKLGVGSRAELVARGFDRSV